MANHVCLPDKRLIGEVDRYLVAPEFVDSRPYFPTGAIAFNTGNVPIALDGKPYEARCMFCIADDHNMRILDKGEGEIILVSLRMGGFYRLFGLEGTDYGGSVIEAGHNRFPHFNPIWDALKTAPQSLEGRVEALNGAFLELLNESEPYGLGEKFRFMAEFTKGQMRVEDAAERLSVSVRTLERECRKRFWRTPKRIMRGYRIAPLLALGEDPPPAWADRDDTHGYSDQAHFLRDHRTLGGMNPGEMFEALRDLPYRTEFHLRDLAITGDYGDEWIKAAFQEHFRWHPYGEEIVKELGLEDWDTA